MPARLTVIPTPPAASPAPPWPAAATPGIACALKLPAAASAAEDPGAPAATGSSAACRTAPSSRFACSSEPIRVRSPGAASPAPASSSPNGCAAVAVASGSAASALLSPPLASITPTNAAVTGAPIARPSIRLRSDTRAAAAGAGQAGANEPCRRAAITGHRLCGHGLCAHGLWADGPAPPALRQRSSDRRRWYRQIPHGWQGRPKGLQGGSGGSAACGRNSHVATPSESAGKACRPAKKLAEVRPPPTKPLVEYDVTFPGCVFQSQIKLRSTIPNPQFPIVFSQISGQRWNRLIFRKTSR